MITMAEGTGIEERINIEDGEDCGVVVVRIFEE